MRGFPSPAGFRKWLERNHGAESELLVRCFKNHAAERGMTYFQALDEALCFGWIDGVRRRLDADSFSVRFSPRKAGSFWSAVNTRHAKRLLAEGRMRPPGLAAFRKRDSAAPRRYSFEAKPRGLAPAYLRKLKATPRAFAFFQSRPPGYRRTCAFWVMSAKRHETREKRLGILIDCSARGTTIPLLTRMPKTPSSS
jgi:uncharacterized protein YdeI (YjbR/CyaY-like superfamily)